MIDIGANLGNEAFSNDLTDVLQRAKMANVQAIIVTGTSAESSVTAARLADQHPGYLYATAGVHPHDADAYNATIEQEILQLLQLKQVVAVGETGLDYNRNFSTPQNQRAAFEAQLALAGKCKKPLFLHEREAFDDFYAIMRANKNHYSHAIVHCFTGNKQALRAYLDMGLYIGITGWICDKKRGAELRDIIRYTPLDRLMIETDAPYLTPHDKSIKQALVNKHRNEPWTLSATAATLAECLDLEADVLIEATTHNTKMFFGI